MSETGTRFDVALGVRSVKDNIAEAASNSGRDPSDVLLVAVSKGGVTVPEILEATRAGQWHFGENRAQDGSAKYAELAKHAESRDIVWHFIGRLQRNKVAQAIRFARYIHSVDRVAVAEKIHIEIHKAMDLPWELKVMIEVNVSGEAVKAGLSENELPEAVARMLEMPHLRVAGLMTMPPITTNPESSRPYFRRLFELRGELNRRFPSAGIHHLSMGMSQDYAVAVEEGATMVRVGRAIFGR